MRELPSQFAPIDPIMISHPPRQCSRLIRAAVIGVCILAPVFPGFADTELTFGQLQEDKQSVSTQRIRIKGERLSIDGGTDLPYMIYYGRYERAYVIDHEKKQYFSLDLDKVTRIVDNLAASRLQALADMEKKLETLPDAQRPQFEKMVEKLREETVQMEIAPERKAEFKSTGDMVSLGGHDTEVVESFVLGKKTATYYVVPRAALGISDADYDVIRKYASFLDSVRTRLPPNLRAHFGDMDMLAGPDEKIPLKVEVEALNGRPEVLLDASTDEIESKVMNVPPSYAAQKLPDVETPK